MLGALGAGLCLLGGAAVGLTLREKRRSRLKLLRAEADMLEGMRLMLTQERLKMGELLTRCAALIPQGEAVKPLAERMTNAASSLAAHPLLGVSSAYRKARESTPISWERAEERELLDALFSQLGGGSAAMREQAVAACLRRLKPMAEQARESCEQSSKLCVQLGVLLGLMLGVAVW